jgi:hypothetical protein
MKLCIVVSNTEEPNVILKLYFCQAHISGLASSRQTEKTKWRTAKYN